MGSIRGDDGERKIESGFRDSQGSEAQSGQVSKERLDSSEATWRRKPTSC